MRSREVPTAKQKAFIIHLEAVFGFVGCTIFQIVQVNASGADPGDPDFVCLFVLNRTQMKMLRLLHLTRLTLAGPRPTGLLVDNDLPASGIGLSLSLSLFLSQ